jgi:hypothetical protein
MKRFQWFGGALVASATFVALSAAASATPVFLLAEWLINGKPVLAELKIEIDGELQLEDNSVGALGKAKVLCSTLFVGWIGPNSLAWVSELLNLADEAISTGDLIGLPLECEPRAGCEANTTVLVWPFGYPKEAEVDLMQDNNENFWVILIFGKVGWHIDECLFFGIPEEDLCESETGAIGGLSLSGTSLLRTYSEGLTLLAELKLATCTVGGAESGVTEGEGTFLPDAAETLSASSDGVEA